MYYSIQLQVSRKTNRSKYFIRNYAISDLLISTRGASLIVELLIITSQLVISRNKTIKLYNYV